MTDTVPVSRELLRQVIGAMIGVFNGEPITGMPIVKSVSALRAALDSTCQDSRQVQTAAEWVRCASPGAQHDVREIIADMQTAPVQEQQPVAWACLFTDDGSLCQTFDTQKEADKWVESDDNLWDVYVAPLYTVQPRKADGCNWPICQTEQYQQDLADQIAKELIGEPRKAVKLSDSEG